jgi:hypothetical protein
MRKIVFVLITIFLLFVNSPVFAAVNISIDSFPSPVTIGQEFSISNTANNLSLNTSYYLKGRIGTGSDFDKAETNNPNNSSPDDWLADTDSWSKFPKISLGDTESSWSGTLKLRAKSSATAGKNSLKVRIKKTDTDTTYDSGTYEITFQPAPTSTPVPTNIPTSTPNPSNTPAPSSTPNPTSSPTGTSIPVKKPTSTTKPREIYEVLDDKESERGTVLGENAPTSTPQIKAPKTEISSSKTSFPLLFLLLGGGMVCIIAAVLLSIKQTRERKIDFP